MRVATTKSATSFLVGVCSVLGCPCDGILVLYVFDCFGLSYRIMFFHPLGHLCLISGVSLSSCISLLLLATRCSEMVSGKCPCAAEMTSFNETPEPPKTNHGDRINGRKRCKAPAKRVPSSFICWESLAQQALQRSQIENPQQNREVFFFWLLLMGTQGSKTTAGS